MATTAVFLSQDLVLDASDRRLATYTNQMVPLAASGQYAATIDVTLPTDTAGDHYLLFVADEENLTMDANRTNNLVAAPISITFSPNLEVTSAEVVASDGVGNVSVSWTVHNSGTEQVSAATWQDAVWFSSDPLLDAGDSLLGYVDILPGGDVLTVGTSYSRASRFSLPIAADGYVIVQADHAQAVPDLQPDDNRILGPI